MSAGTASPPPGASAGAELDAVGEAPTPPGDDDPGDRPGTPPPPADAAEALAALRAAADPARAPGMAAYHKTARPVLGVSMEALDPLVAGWRAGLPAAADRAALAQGLWATEVFEARLAAGRLLVQARMKDDAPVWALIGSWVPQFDGWAVADQVAAAGARRLVQHPERLDEVEGWLDSPHIWTRRAALVFTLPWTKDRHPSPADLARRERILGWAARLAESREWFHQKAVAWWLRDLSRRDPERVRAWLADHGDALAPWAAREAARRLPPAP